MACHRGGERKQKQCVPGGSLYRSCQSVTSLLTMCLYWKHFSVNLRPISAERRIPLKHETGRALFLCGDVWSTAGRSLKTCFRKPITKHLRCCRLLLINSWAMRHAVTYSDGYRCDVTVTSSWCELDTEVWLHWITSFIQVNLGFSVVWWLTHSPYKLQPPWVQVHSRWEPSKIRPHQNKTYLLTSVRSIFTC